MAQTDAGNIGLESILTGTLTTRNGAGTVTNADALPGWKVMGPEGPVHNATGHCTFSQSGQVEAASNASPIVITSASHGLTTGDRVTLAGLQGNTGGNGTFTVTKVDANRFSLDGSSGTGSWTTGGVWNKTGTYTYVIETIGADGYEIGWCYKILFDYAVGGTSFGQVHTFNVI